MTSWKTYRLGDIATMKYGKLPPQNSCGQYPIWSGYRNVGFTDTYNCSKGTIIVVARGVGGTGDVKIAKEDCFLTNLSIAVNIDTDICLPQYFYYKFYLSNLRYLDSGSAQSQITIDDLKRLQISLPGLEEQRRIAGILGAIDDKIENNRRINTNLELQAQALFEKWISKSKTSKGVFDDIIQTTLAGDWGQETTQGNYTHEVFCIRGADIPALQNGDKGKMPIRYILEKNYKTKQLRANDLVIEISGGSPTQSTGRICMIAQSLLDRLGKDVICTNFCRAITPKNGYAIYIYLYWQMLYNKNTMFSYENGTTGIKNLNIADLISKEPIEIPAQEDVEKLNIVLQPIFDQIYANGLQNETLATLRDSLLPKLMNGEIITK